jgi:rubrerythrin
MALEKERQSIELYQKLLLHATDDRELFEYLIKQEQEHYGLLEEIIKMVNRPNEWVESAEFGLREEY